MGHGLCAVMDYDVSFYSQNHDRPLGLPDQMTIWGEQLSQTIQIEPSEKHWLTCHQFQYLPVLKSNDCHNHNSRGKVWSHD